jgi:hypothetical protein
VLEYGNPADPSELPPSPFSVRVALLVVGLAAGASAFLPFTYNTAPVDVWIELLTRRTPWDRERLFLIATPFFVGLPLAAWRVKRLFRPALSRGQRIAMYAVGLCGAALTTGFFVSVLAAGDLTPREIAQVLVGPTTLVVGTGTVARLLWRRHRDEAASVALTAGYACNGAMLVAAMYSPDHVGWWVTLAAVVGVAVEWAYLMILTRRSFR